MNSNSFVIKQKQIQINKLYIYIYNIYIYNIYIYI